MSGDGGDSEADLLKPLKLAGLVNSEYRESILIACSGL
jgi:hypothetical protein